MIYTLIYTLKLTENIKQFFTFSVELAWCALDTDNTRTKHNVINLNNKISIKTLDFFLVITLPSFSRWIKCWKFPRTSACLQQINSSANNIDQLIIYIFEYILYLINYTMQGWVNFGIGMCYQHLLFKRYIRNPILKKYFRPS